MALYPQLMMSYGEIGWWIGHGLELVGVVLVGAPVALDLVALGAIAAARR